MLHAHQNEEGTADDTVDSSAPRHAFAVVSLVGARFCVGARRNPIARRDGFSLLCHVSRALYAYEVLTPRNTRERIMLRLAFGHLVA